VSRNYLDWLPEVGCEKRSPLREHAEKILNRDHYGLEKIKFFHSGDLAKQRQRDGELSHG